MIVLMLATETAPGISDFMQSWTVVYATATRDCDAALAVFCLQIRAPRRMIYPRSLRLIPLGRIAITWQDDVSAK